MEQIRIGHLSTGLNICNIWESHVTVIARGGPIERRMESNRRVGDQRTEERDGDLISLSRGLVLQPGLGRLPPFARGNLQWVVGSVPHRLANWGNRSGRLPKMPQPSFPRETIFLRAQTPQREPPPSSENRPLAPDRCQAVQDGKVLSKKGAILLRRGGTSLDDGPPCTPQKPGGLGMCRKHQRGPIWRNRCSLFVNRNEHFVRR
jgi:hypothetical protein